MNKMAVAMLPLMLLASLPMPTFAAEPPACSGEMISEVDYNGIEAVEHKWYCLYNSNHYTVKFYSKNRRLLGWEITKDLPGDAHIVISERDFTEDGTNPPLCGYETISYFDYEEYHVKEHKWRCIYDNDFYVIKVYTQDGSSILLGWQIFKNWHVVSSKRFI